LGEQQVGVSSFLDTLAGLGGTVRRQLPLVFFVLFCGLGASLLYLLTATSRYTATASMVIDTRKVQLFQQQSVVGDAPIDSGTVQTEVEILKSRNVAVAVVNNLRLLDDPEFTGQSPGIVGIALHALTSILAGGGQDSEQHKLDRAVGMLAKRMAVSRVGLTYVMSISFDSVDPSKAASIANGIADAYVTDQLEAKYQATKRASLWLQDRITELRTQASAADHAVVDFKQKNNITAVDANGTLMNQQQMSDINTQLILAQATTAEAKAKLDRINEVMKDAIPDASVTDALQSQVIIALRAKYLDLAGREALFSSQYGPNHLATIGLRNQMMELRRNVSDEMAKIAESYKSNYEIAKARQTSLETSLNMSVSSTNLTNQALVQLRELESSAQSYKSMYDNFLQMYMQSVQQQSFPITEARIISAASVPPERSSPKPAVVLTASILGSLLIGLGAAALREGLDKVFRTSRQVEDRLKVNCLAMVPIVRSDTSKKPIVQPDRANRVVSSEGGLWHYAVEQPFSQFTEALRSVKVAGDLANGQRSGKIIGITSTLPNEGKSTISSNLAQLMAHAGAKVLLVDCDLRNPSLSRRLTQEAPLGLVDLISGQRDFEEVVWRDEVSGLRILPVGGGEARLAHTSEIIGSPASKALFVSFREIFEYVIVDLSPLAPVVDTRTTSSFVDTYVYVVEWGRTRMDIVEHNLLGAPEVFNKVLGVLMNKADMKVLGRYEDYNRHSYYKSYYSRYLYNS
jgi:succinoglycan biosynthesis transport protein ExoP